MKIGFFLSTLGGSPLIGGLERGFRELGHSVEQYRNGSPCDLIVICNQSAHTTAYQYPDFPLCNAPLLFLDSAEYGYFKRLPSVVGQYATAFSPGSMDHDTKNKEQQTRLQRHLTGKSFPYFLREFSKYLSFPQGYHPIDYPLYHLSQCHRVPSIDEYRSRQLELFISWGASHPWRMNLTEAARSCHRKSEISVIGENGFQRMPQALYFSRTSAARCSVSFDGYGSGSFRMTEVLVRTLLLQGPLSIETRAPLIGGKTCIGYDVHSNGVEFVSTDLCHKMQLALDDVDGSFDIYRDGYYHCMDHLTERATAQYVIDVVERHDYSKPTELDIAATVHPNFI